MKKQAAANVNPVRQRTQYSCMSTSMMMCLRALDIDTNEDEVNRVMGAKPMQGASWEDAIACAQHYGARVHLICPATVRQLKEFTDRGIPLMIAWNPEGRDWSHASVVFDVDDDLNVHVADPNIPDPDETVRVVPKGDFYKKWFEKWPNYLVRRPAMAIEPEISPEGRQMVASKTAAGSYRDWRGKRHRTVIDDEGYGRPRGRRWTEQDQYNLDWADYEMGLRDKPPEPLKKPKKTPKPRVEMSFGKDHLQVLDTYLAQRPNNKFMSAMRDLIQKKRKLTEKQLSTIRRNLYQARMRSEADLFRPPKTAADRIAARYLGRKARKP